MRAKERDCEREFHFGMDLYDARMLIGGSGRKLARTGARGKGTEREHNWWAGEANATKTNA